MSPTSQVHDPASIDRTQVVAEYSIFWKESSPHKRVLLLQFPGRYKKEPYNLANQTKPSEIRIKPQSGLVELDVPIYLGLLYDPTKGARFNSALRQSRARHAGLIAGKGDYGLAGGFGINAHIHGRTARPGIGMALEGRLDGALEAEDDGLAARTTKLTLGGRLRMFKHGDPIYAIGTFRGDSLHLSKVDGICSLQPQFHHLDAISDNDRVSSRMAAGADHPVVESEARAVNMTVKSTDQEQIDVSEVDQTLRAMQEESWERLEWVDESDPQAFVAFENDLMLIDSTKASNLISTMSESQYLDAISAPRIDPTRQGRRVMISRQWEDGTGEAIEEDDDEDAKPLIEGTGHRKNPGSRKSSNPKAKVELD